MQSFITDYISNSISTKQAILSNVELQNNIAAAIKQLLDCFKNDKKLLLCGNGGSTCDAMHIAEELTGKYKMERPPLPAISLTDASHITCTANDYGFEAIFERGVNALGQQGDCLLAISTSGNSVNIIRAAEAAKNKGIKVIAFTGETGGKLAAQADILINIPSTITSHIQEAHITIGHLLIEQVELQLFANTNS